MAEEDWTFINQFHNNDEMTPEDVIDLEVAMMRILNEMDIDKHSKDLGYSKRFPRYNRNFPGLTDKQELEALRKHYWARSRQVQNASQAERRRQQIRDHTYHGDSCA